MDFKSMGACFMMEITNIGPVVDKSGPEGVIKWFIKTYSNPWNKDQVNFPRPFYVFSGVEDVTKGSFDPITVKVGYASKLARYITKHKLGRIWRTDKRYNFTYHPTHNDQIFIWAPSKEGLQAWYDKNMKNKKEEVQA